MRVFASACTFAYSWEEVSTANWRKYCPWNHASTHVLAVDTLARNVDASTGILRTERLITCQQAAPGWVLKLLGGSSVSHVHEVSYVDPARKTVKMSSTNLSWNNVLSVRETVTYRQERWPAVKKGERGEEDPSRTHFQQEAKITALCGGWQKIRNKIEEASVERFGENAKKGREGFESVLEMSRRVFGEEREKMGMAGESR